MCRLSSESFISAGAAFGFSPVSKKFAALVVLAEKSTKAFQNKYMNKYKFTNDVCPVCRADVLSVSSV